MRFFFGVCFVFIMNEWEEKQEQKTGFGFR
jgi:hypothetical protein